jgi:hypothetical protein
MAMVRDFEVMLGKPTTILPKILQFCAVIYVFGLLSLNRKVAQ